MWSGLILEWKSLPAVTFGDLQHEEMVGMMDKGVRTE